MDEQPTKRRGPLTWLAARSRWFWFGVVLCVPILYLLSIGPQCYLINRKALPGWLDRVTRKRSLALVFTAMERAPEWARPAVDCYDTYLSIWIDASLDPVSPAAPPATPASGSN